MQKFKCEFCNKNFDESDLGMLECYYHPLNYKSYRREMGIKSKYGINHFDCCGASIDRSDANHYEFIKPNGCHKIDHRTKEGALYLNKKPYHFCELSKAHKYKIYSNYINNEKTSEKPSNLFIFEKESDMPTNHNFTIELPLQRKLHLNLTELQKKLKTSIQNEYDEIITNFKKRHNLPLKKQKTSSYKELQLMEEILFEQDEIQNNENNNNSSSKKDDVLENILQLQELVNDDKFIPFCIIVRVDPTIDKHKLRNIDVNHLCNYQK